MEVKQYLREKRAESLKDNDKQIVPLLSAGWDFIESRMMENFNKVNPEFVRKLEMLEVLLLSFISHGYDFSKLDELDDYMKGLKSSGRQIQ